MVSLRASLYCLVAVLVAVTGGRTPVSANPAVLATLDGAPITEEDVRKVVQGKLVSIESELYEARKQGIDTIITNRLLEREAKAKNLTVDQLIQQEVTAKVPEPTSQEIQGLYDQNKERIGKPLEEVRGMIRDHLHGAKIEALRAHYVNQLIAKANVSVHIKPPTVEIPGTGPSRGPANAPITIVEFSDFECPYCGRAEESVKQVMDAYKDKVRLVYRDYPLSFHRNAQKAAEAARCAGDQNKYWEYHATLFENQTALDAESLKKYATDLELDAKKFQQCLDQNKYADTVQKDFEVGNAIGVSGTPAFFINGRLLSGAQPFEAFKQIIDEILADKGAAS
jgi:protein-disulfide isomerase